MSTSHDSSAARTLRSLLGLPREAPAAAPAGASLRAVAEGRPARTVAGAVAAAAGPDAETGQLLEALVRDHLGGDAERWLGLHDALATHRGTLPELLADVPPPAHPVPPASPGGLRPPAPRSVHATLALLLEHAPPKDAAAAVAVLPDRTLDGLLATGSLPGPAVTAAVTEYGDPRTRTALARHTRLDSRVLARLLDTGDPQVGAAVYRNPRATQSLRRTLVHRLDRIPLDEALYAELADRGASVPHTWLAPLLGSGDPQLAARALIGGARGVAQQYALVRVWERTGPEAVRALLDDPGVRRCMSRAVVSDVAGALAADDGSDDGSGEALRALRERCEPYEDPARLPALLATTRGTSSLRDLLSEPYVHDLNALAQAHAASPFMPKASEELARHEAADDTQRLAFRLSTLNAPWRTGGRRAGNTAPPRQRLAEEELDDHAGLWAEGMAAAGLLNPVDLIATAHPAARALHALDRLARRKLLGGAAVAALHELAADRLGDRPEAWAAFDTLLPRHPGTLSEVLTEAGKAPAPQSDGSGGSGGAGGTGTGAPTAGPQDGEAAAPDTRPAAPDRSPAVAEAAEAPAVPRGPRMAAALAALDLLRSLAPGEVPLPADPGVLRFLAHHHGDTAPGLATPQWLVEACAAHGIAPPHGSWPTAPTPDEILAAPVTTWGTGVQPLERAYTQGIVQAADLTAVLPARHLLQLPHDWRRLAFAAAWRAETGRLLRAELGTDPDAWLRLADTAAGTAGHAGSTASGESVGGPGWVELLRLARSGDTAPAGYRPPEERAYASYTARPDTPDEAVRMADRGNHLWLWPIGTLLCVADDAEVVDAVLPRLGPDGPWLLAAYLLRHDRTPRTVLDRLLAGRDPQALRVLASQTRWLSPGAAELLADLGEPDVDLALLRHGTTAQVARRIVARSRPGGTHPAEGLGARVLAVLRADPSAGPVGDDRWLTSAEPDLIEEVFARRTGLSLAQQVLGCLHLCEHGGRDRLAALVARGVLGQAATTLCVKALESGDPAAVLRARADRELAPGKLVARLRRATHHWQTTGVLRDRPYGIDWEAVESAHAEDPLPQWPYIVRHPDAPAALRLRHAGLVEEPGPDGLPDGPELTLARARHGLGGRHGCAAATQFDGLLASGHLGAADLLHEAAPAAVVLAYLSGASRRADAPPQAQAALGALADLVAARLGTDPGAWSRVTTRLTARDPHWNPSSPVTSLLT
ncbi:hypothetical protein ABZ924_20355 [Streptomyces sp. NPDC046876]|uniref:hypothetical protein n=1 Tax=Streptomyces sp. NPDC046876 TaxID=3155616 RepID=UPI00340E216F